MRTLALLLSVAALWSGTAGAGEIVILESGTPQSRTRAPHHSDGARDSFIILERPSREEALGRRDPGREAKRASRDARRMRVRKK